jgi:hypothetical protein
MRAPIQYGLEPSRKMEGIETDWLEPGFYKVRLTAGGPWVPIEVFLEDGDRNPETWELESDQYLTAEWWPSADSLTGYSVNPKFLFNRARPITKDEFQWLKALRTIPRRSRAQSSL